MTQARSFVEIIRERSRKSGPKVAFRYLPRGESSEPGDALDFLTLDLKARALAAGLQTVAQPGDRILVAFPPGLDFIVAFFACLYARVVAVPVYPPDSERLLHRAKLIAAHCGAQLVLTSHVVAGKVGELGLAVITIEDTVSSEATNWREDMIAPGDLAFLQYTSGSTGSPRGVMISHGNLIHNSRQIHQAFELEQESTAVIWLPPYHDMGLIGGVLQTVFAGSTTILMSPQSFLQRPMRWLEAISHWRSAASGGPDFGYALCARKATPQDIAKLDLSTWQLAFNGAEPLQRDTLDRFVKTFAPCGFRAEAMYPCYGLAEGTLFVTGGKAGVPPTVTSFDAAALEFRKVIPAAGGTSHVACGYPRLGQQVRIVDPDTCAEVSGDAAGEIWVKGKSVAAGYWGGEDGEFHGSIAGGDGELFLRTGDIGFFHEGQLYVTGRLKDVVIIRGRNIWPQDVEATVEASHDAIRSGHVAVFPTNASAGEGLCVVARVRAASELSPEIAAEISRAVNQAHGVVPQEIALITGPVPHTPTGKIQRRGCREGIENGSIRALYRTRYVDAAPAAQALTFSLMFFSSDAASGGGYDLFLDAVRAADRLGFEAVWIPERHFHPFGGLYPNPSVLAAAAATATRSLRIRAGSVVLPLHDPLRVAEEWAVVDRLSGGRVDIAFATGWNANDFVLTPDRFDERRSATFSAIETVQRLWRGEAIDRLNGRGDLISVRTFPRPHQPQIPIWLTCSGGEERFIDAGERGLNVLTALLFQTPEQLAGKITAYRDAAARAGHPRGRVTLMLHTFVAHDMATVDAAVEGPLEAYLESSVNLWRQASEPLQKLTADERRAVLAFAAQRYRRDSALIGTPESCAAVLDRVRAAGVDEIACLIDFGVNASAVLTGLETLDLLRHQPGAVRVAPVGAVDDASLLPAVWEDLKSVLGTLPAGASASYSFADLGLDSIRGVELMHRLETRLKRPLHASMLFGCRTVGAFAAALAGRNIASVPQLDLEREAILPADIVIDARPSAFTATPARVLLTGATGFLGAFMLHALLVHTDAEVVCLVRASDSEHALKRLCDGLAEYGIFNEAWRSRIVPLCGDLRSPGIVEPLADSLDAIYHAGALVNFAYDYAACRDANVGGTLAVIRLACSGKRLIPLHYVSTTAVFSQAYAGSVVTPADLPADSTRLDMGYAQTKWVAERLVVQARDLGLPVSIYRPGLITGAADTGACHLTNFVWNLIRVSAEIGTLPDYDRVIDMAPVDWVASSIVQRSLSPASIGGVCHLVNPAPVSISRLGDWLRARGYSIHTEPFERWQIQVMQKVITTPSLNALLPILSLASAEFYERRQVRYDAPEAAGAFAIPCPPADDALLDCYLDWFVARGFLPAPGAANATLQRSHDVLDVKRLHNLVVQITGRSDLGDGDWMPPFEIPLEDMKRNVSFRPGGLERATTRLVNALIRRSQLVDLWRRHPEIADVPIRRPIFIVAPPRTGTTLLHNLLALDPSHRAPALWEMMGPAAPARANAQWESHMQRVAREFIEETYERSPALRAIHPMDAMHPDECHWLMACNATTLVHSVAAYVPGYVEWMLQADIQPAYAFYRRAQQALLWRRPGETLVCKDPWHIWHLNALFAIFPDAVIVQLHRSMEEAVPSFCSLAQAVQSVESEPPSAAVLGRYGLDLLTSGIDRMLAVRQTAKSAVVVDIAYRELVDQPVEAVRRVYRAAGRELIPDVETRIASYLAANPRGRAGVHRYDLDTFGLKAEDVRERFEDYTARFLPPG